MSETEVVLLKLSSVALTREKQTLLEHEFTKYWKATNWVIKKLLKTHLTRRSQIIKTIQQKFSEKFDERPTYMRDVIKTAASEITRHRNLAVTIRSMRDKTPFFKQGRVIFSQPIVNISKKVITVRLADRTTIPIPYDKFSRNQNADAITGILRGEPAKPDASGISLNKRYERVRLTWNTEGFVNIDIRAKLPKS